MSAAAVFLAVSLSIPSATAPVPTDAVTWALTDLLTMESSSRTAVRYVWIPPWGDESWIGATTWSVNVSCNRSGTLVKPVVAANGWLLRWDLRYLAPEPEQLASLLSAWDSLALLEPYFHVPAQQAQTTVAVAAPYINPDHVGAFSGVNFSAALVYRADWLMGKLLLTTEGGRYYDFAGITGKTQEDLFASLGLDEKQAKELNGDIRAAVLVSQVTGKPRRVDRYQGLVGRHNSGSIWITRDPADGDRAEKNHPLYNMLAFRDTGRELIWERSDGLHGFAVLTNLGQLLPSVPDNVATDHTIPPPHTKRLAPALSCIRCHAQDSGLRKVSNDAQTLLTQSSVAYDTGEQDQFAALTRISGLYQGDFERRLEIGRQDYDAASIRLSGMPAAQVSNLVAEIYAGWRYETVDAAGALPEIGFIGDNEGALELFSQLVRTEGQEDPILAAMRAGLSVSRQDWDRVYVTAMSRALINGPSVEASIRERITEEHGNATADESHTVATGDDGFIGPRRPER